MFEGHDTTAAAMNFMVYTLGADAQRMKKAQAELDEFLPNTDDLEVEKALEEFEITYDDLKRLDYLDACSRETLRLYPSVPIISREHPSGNQSVNAGICITAVNRDPRHWTNPDSFNPERFLDGGNDMRTVGFRLVLDTGIALVNGLR